MLGLFAMWLGAFIAQFLIAKGAAYVLRKVGVDSFLLACVLTVIFAVTVYTLLAATGDLSIALITYVPPILLVYALSKIKGVAPKQANAIARRPEAEPLSGARRPEGDPPYGARRAEGEPPNRARRAEGDRGSPEMAQRRQSYSAAVLSLMLQSQKWRETFGTDDPRVVVRRLRLDSYFDSIVNDASDGGAVTPQQCADTMVAAVIEAEQKRKDGAENNKASDLVAAVIEAEQKPKNDADYNKALDPGDPRRWLPGPTEWFADPAIDPKGPVGRFLHNDPERNRDREWRWGASGE
jgi:hypothetical protein